MDEEDMLPLKRVEPSLSKFNDVAIPHHLQLLRQYRTNIQKWSEAGEWRRVRMEQTNAGRAAGQLRSLLAELEALRGQVRAEDRARFDSLTRRARDHTLRALAHYLESTPAEVDDTASASAEPEVYNGSAVASSASVAKVEARRAALEEREAALQGWRELQKEVAALHDAWRTLHDAAHAQADSALQVSRHVDVAAANVADGRGSLARAAKWRTALWPAAGAAAGAALGGPLGLLLGLKAAAAALLAGSVLGYSGASMLARRQHRLD